MKIFMTDEEGNYVRDAGVDEIGSLCIKGPNVFKGYLEDRHNKGIWPQEGWLNTGDMGRQDSDNYFWVTGRLKELIIRGGHNIDPALIEEPLYQLPDVLMAAAVGRPDQRVGELPVAYVQLHSGSTLTVEKIKEHLQQAVGERAAIPKEVYIVDEMPLTTVGKIFKPALKREVIKNVYLDDLQALGDMVEQIDIEIGEDKIHGSLAVITVKAAQSAEKDKIRRRVDELLAAYTTRYQVIIND